MIQNVLCELEEWKNFLNNEIYLTERLRVQSCELQGIPPRKLRNLTIKELNLNTDNLS